MSIQDDIFEIEHSLETGTDLEIAQKAWQSLYEWLKYLEEENERLAKENSSMKHVITIKS